MRLKYRICNQKNGNLLNIQESVVDEKGNPNLSSAMLRDEHFDLVAEQHYDAETVARGAAGGSDAMVAILRTPNLFPIAPYAARVAESVMHPASSGSDGCVELFFDDNDLFVAGLRRESLQS